MKKNLNISALVCILIMSMTTSCIEELDLNEAISKEGKGLLVVEASLTDTNIKQKVYLSRSETRFDLETDTVYSYVYPLGIGDRDSVNVEQNARISVIADNGEVFQFSEDEPGTYLSNQAFALQLNQDYRLEITTSDGADFTSDAVKIESSAVIKDVIVERTFNKEGVEGVEISVNSETTAGIPEHYRYTYEETFKIIAPNWNPQDFLLENYDPYADCIIATYDLSIVDREIQNRVCYKTVPSNTIIQTNLTDASNNINNFPVRFIRRDNFIISYRYSILVKQHVQSIKAYNFYATLNNLSQSDEVFSQIQPGSLVANVKMDGNDDVKVLGYVEAVSSSEQRIYFNYEDLFPNEDIPEFPFDCSETDAPEGHISYCFQGLSGNTCELSLVERLHLGLSTYIGINHEPERCGEFFVKDGPFRFIARVCGDCTILGENVAPDFWEE